MKASGHEKLHVHRTKHMRLKHLNASLDLVVLDVAYKSYRCSHCGKVATERIPLRCGSGRYTSYDKAECLAFLRGYGSTMKQVARTMHASPALVKDIKKKRLEYPLRDSLRTGDDVTPSPGKSPESGVGALFQPAVDGTQPRFHHHSLPSGCRDKRSRRLPVRWENRKLTFPHPPPS